jgi:outer membrane receptor protein involved in Fe transport
MSNESNTAAIIPNHRKALAVAISTAIVGTGTAQAAEMVLEEIIVTATKREASLQDIAMSVTAFTDEKIVLEQFKQIDDYAGQIAGLTVNRRQPGGTNVIMRGCAVASVSFGGSSTTSIYLDEQPITVSGFNPDPRLVDIQRVEALSGPQGTLFGDAAQCGTLRIITNKPDSGGFTGFVDLTGNTVKHGDLGYDINGMVNIPLVEDKLALRLVGFHVKEAGFIDNILAPGLPGPFGPTSGAPYDNSEFVDDDVNSATTSGGRVALRWTPNETWTIDASAIFQNLDVDGMGDVDLSEGPHEDDVIGELEQIRYGDEKFKDEWYQLALTVEARLGFADVMATGAYMERKTRYDMDSTAYAFLYAQDNGYEASFYDFGERRHFSNDEGKVTTETFEARMTTPSDSDSRWAGIVGFFYNKTEDHTVFTANGIGLGDGCTTEYAADCAAYSSTRSSYLHYYYYGTFGPEASDNWWTGDYNTETKNTAVFGEVSFDVTDNFSITAGGRWFEVKQTFFNANGPTVNLASDLPPSPILICATEAEEDNWLNNGVPVGRFVHTCFNDTTATSKDSDFVPKLSAAYNFNDDKMVYFTYSEGFRRGGVNSAKQGSFAEGGALHAYNPDTIKNYEVGFKGTTSDGRFRLNATFYHMVWDDIQIQVFDPDATFFSLGIINLAEAEINGVEGSFSWIPADNWTISGMLGYNNAELSEEAVDEDLGVDLPKGQRLPLMPKLKTNLEAKYTSQRQIWGGDPWVLANWTYRGDSLNSLGGLGGTASLNETRTHPSLNTVNLRTGLDYDTWNVQFFITNLFNDRASTLFNDRWIQVRSSINRPRTFGINYRKTFGN